jgi:hypothetical protein
MGPSLDAIHKAPADGRFRQADAACGCVAGDSGENLWRRYYAAIFNPARLKVGAMLKEMARKY